MIIWVQVHFSCLPPFSFCAIQRIAMGEFFIRLAEALVFSVSSQEKFQEVVDFLLDYSQDAV